MKKLLFLFFFISLCSSLVSESRFPPPFASSSKDQIKIYWCSRLTSEIQAFNNQLRVAFDSRFALFLPQEIDLSSYTKEKKDLVGYIEDLRALKEAHILFLVTPFGRDCCWEVGWACGRGLFVIAYVENNLNFLEDSMVKESLHCIITSSKKAYATITQDPTKKSKCYLIASREELSPLVWKLYSSFVSQKSKTNELSAFIERHIQNSR